MSALPVLAIFGPTSVGKTDLAIQIAGMMGERGTASKAVSADAYAIYREIPIITGAPTEAQQRELPHACVATTSVTEAFSVGSFAGLAHEEIDHAASEGLLPIVVGGTGLYLRAAVSNLDLQPPVDPLIRERLMVELTQLGPQILHSRLLELSPDAASVIEPGDSQRIVRTLELLEAGRAPRLAGSERLWATPPRRQTVAIGLTMDRQLQRDRIAERIDLMIAQGAVAEVEAAWELGPSSTASAAIGMKELPTGDVDRMRFRTWQFAKRQMTWLRRLEDVELIDVTGRETSSVVAEIVEVYDQAGSA